MLDHDDATSHEEPTFPNKQKDTLYILHQKSDHKCSVCHVNIDIGYHCTECNVSAPVFMSLCG